MSAPVSLSSLVNYANRQYPAISGNEPQWFNQEFQNIRNAVNSTQQVLKSGNWPTLGIFAKTLGLTGTLSGVAGTFSGALSAVGGTFSGALSAVGISSTSGVAVSGGTLGYATGVGGTVTQATSKTTGVTLNKICGAITTSTSATTANTALSFTVTNSTVAATDSVQVNHASGGTVGDYVVTVIGIAAGSFKVMIYPLASLSEALVLNFAVIKAVTS